MQLINALAAGVTGAENGRARIFRRGTTRRATYHLDFEASSSYTQDVELDEYGSAVVYTEMSVDVAVYDSSYSLLRRFTESSTAGCVEVISPSFTGQDYVTQRGGANKPTTLEAVLDLALTSFGAEDWKVLMPDGTKLTMRNAISAVTGIFYNVKSPLYGAVGDGVTDDFEACQAAIDAASDAGGGTVFFPAGTYLISDQLEVPSTVSLLGAGSTVSVVRSSKTDGSSIAFTSGGSGVQTVVGMRFFNTTTAARSVIEVQSGAKLSIRSCSFVADAVGYPGIDVKNTTGSDRTYVSIEDCDFSCEGDRGAIRSLLDARNGRVDIRRCRFATTSSFSYTGGVVHGANTHLYGCVFDSSLTTSGSFSYIRPAFGVGGSYGSARCCEFLDSGGATVSCFYLGTLGDESDWFAEDGNNIQGDATNLTLYELSSDTTENYYAKLGTRESRYKAMSLTTTTVALTEVKQYGIITVRTTGAGALTLTADALAPLGAKLRVLLVNNSGASRNLTFGANMKGGQFTLADNEAIGLEFTSANVHNGTSASHQWYLTSTSGALISGADSSYAV